MLGTLNESSSDLVLHKKRLTNFHQLFPKWQRLEKIISENKFPDMFLIAYNWETQKIKN